MTMNMTMNMMLNLVMNLMSIAKNLMPIWRIKMMAHIGMAIWCVGHWRNQGYTQNLFKPS
jgi:hypothetical protein